MMLKYGSFSLTAIFSLLWALGFDVYAVFKIPQLWTENTDFWFSPNCSSDCTLHSGILNSTCKNCDIRLVLCRCVTYEICDSDSCITWPYQIADDNYRITWVYNT